MTYIKKNPVSSPPHSLQRREAWQTPHTIQRQHSKNCVQPLPRRRGLGGGHPPFGGAWGAWGAGRIPTGCHCYGTFFFYRAIHSYGMFGCNSRNFQLFWNFLVFFLLSFQSYLI